MNWLDAINVQRTLRNVETDILGDWYRDPWGWPELRYVADAATQLIVGRLNETGAHRVLTLDVPKENFVIRPAVILDPLDRFCYQALVDTLSKTLIGSVPSWAYGWRLPRKDSKQGEYASNSREWEFYRQRLNLLAVSEGQALTTDIVSFFASIPVGTLAGDLRATAGDGAVVSRIESFLEDLQSVPNRSGLPQRCWASSVLAHFYLAPIDDYIQAYAPRLKFFKKKSSPAAARWMDDLWIGGDDGMTLRMIQLELQDILNRRGLRLNAGKTELLHGERLLRQVHEIEHSAVDSALAKPSKDEGPLNEMVDSLLAEPDVASRTSLRFATTRIRKHQTFNLANGFVDAAMRLPHGADHLARLFRDSGQWRQLQQWYIDQVNQYGRNLTWTTYHLGTMFPSNETPGNLLIKFWADALANGSLPPLHVPLVAQRLASWEPITARNAIRAASRQAAYEHPFVIRALALAGRAANIPAAETGQLLHQFVENEVTLQYLNARKMRAPQPTNDFAGI